MKIVVAASACALILTSAAAWAQAPSPVDRQFAVKASIGNQFEIQSSRLALQRSSSPEIRAMARWMIKDHTMAQQMLNTAASATGTEAGPVLDDEHSAKISDLSGMTGSGFDQAYVKDQVAAHRETDQTLRDFQQMGDDPSLLAWADKTLPAVDMHLSHFEILAPSM